MFTFSRGWAKIAFFHPLVRYARRQLNLKRELACDDRVVELGTAAEVYAAGILKVVERSLTPGGMHQLALFSTKQVLERRIEMILRTDRVRVINANWRYLVLPVALLTLVSMLVLPASTAMVSVTAPDPIADEEVVKVFNLSKVTGGIPVLLPQSPWDIVVKVHQGGGGYTINDREDEYYPSLDDLGRRLKEILSLRPSDRKMVVVRAPETFAEKEAVKVLDMIKMAGGVPILLQSSWDLIVAISEGGQRYNLNTEDYQSLGDLSRRLREVLNARPTDKKTVSVVAPDSLADEEMVKVFNVIKAAGGTPIKYKIGIEKLK